MFQRFKVLLGLIVAALTVFGLFQVHAAVVLNTAPREVKMELQSPSKAKITWSTPAAMPEAYTLMEYELVLKYCAKAGNTCKTLTKTSQLPMYIWNASDMLFDANTYTHQLTLTAVYRNAEGLTQRSALTKAMVSSAYEPVAITVKELTTSSATISWNKVDWAEKYTVKLGASPVKELSASTLTYTQKALSSGQAYTLTVEAKKGDIVAIGSVTVTPKQVVFAANPDNGVLKKGGSIDANNNRKLVFTWTAPESAKKFRVQIWKHGTGGGKIVEQDTTEKTFTWDVVANSDHVFQVAIVHDDGSTSTYGAYTVYNKEVKTDEELAKEKALAEQKAQANAFDAPKNFYYATDEQIKNKITLYWSHPDTYSKVKYYRLYIKKGSKTYIANGFDKLSRTKTSLVLKDLTWGETQGFAIAAIGYDDTNSAITEFIEVTPKLQQTTTSSQTTGGAITLNHKLDAGTLTLSWNPISNKDIDGYAIFLNGHLHRKLALSTKPSFEYVVPTGSTIHTIQVKGLYKIYETQKQGTEDVLALVDSFANDSAVITVSHEEESEVKDSTLKAASSTPISVSITQVIPTKDQRSTRDVKNVWYASKQLTMKFEVSSEKPIAACTLKINDKSFDVSLLRCKSGTFIFDAASIVTSADEDLKLTFEALNTDLKKDVAEVVIPYDAWLPELSFKGAPLSAQNTSVTGVRLQCDPKQSTCDQTTYVVYSTADTFDSCEELNTEVLKDFGWRLCTDMKNCVIPTIDAELYKGQQVALCGRVMNKAGRFVYSDLKNISFDTTSPTETTLNEEVFVRFQNVDFSSNRKHIRFSFQAKQGLSLEMELVDLDTEGTETDSMITSDEGNYIYQSKDLDIIEGHKYQLTITLAGGSQKGLQFASKPFLVPKSHNVTLSTLRQTLFDTPSDIAQSQQVNVKLKAKDGSDKAYEAKDMKVMSAVNISDLIEGLSSSKNVKKLPIGPYEVLLNTDSTSRKIETVIEPYYYDEDADLNGDGESARFTDYMLLKIGERREKYQLAEQQDRKETISLTIINKAKADFKAMLRQ